MDKLTEKRFWVISKIIALRNEIPVKIQKQIGYEDVKIAKYLKRSFSRWIFNLIKNGKDPFVTLTNHKSILAIEFVMNTDLQYLFQSLNKLESLKLLDWNWLDKEFHKISEGPKHTLIKHKVNIVHSDNIVTLSRDNYKFKLNQNQYDTIISKLNQFPTNNNTHSNDNNNDKINMHTHIVSGSIGGLSANTAALDEYVFMLLLQYKGCGGHNNHCSVPPDVIRFTKAKTELFGSPFNTCLEQYCSPFYDIEKEFGSLGSFFDFELETGTYIMNPPYDEELMESASKRILRMLDGPKEITIIVVYPLWDMKSQLKHRGVAHVDKEFVAYELLKKSKYLRSCMVLSHDIHKFFDYFAGLYSSVADAHLMVISNTTYQTTAQEISSYWQYHCK